MLTAAAPVMKAAPQGAWRALGSGGVVGLAAPSACLGRRVPSAAAGSCRLGNLVARRGVRREISEKISFRGEA
jgi:hypothetical protein